MGLDDRSYCYDHSIPNLPASDDPSKSAAQDPGLEIFAAAGLVELEPGNEERAGLYSTAERNGGDGEEKEC